MKEKIQSNQQPADKMLPVKDTIELLQKMDLLPWAKKTPEQQDSSKETLQKDAKLLAAEKQPENKDNSAVYGLNTRKQTNDFLNHKEGEKFRVEALKKLNAKDKMNAEIKTANMRDKMIADMRKKGLMAALKKALARYYKSKLAKQKKDKENKKLLSHAYEEYAKVIKHLKEDSIKHNRKPEQIALLSRYQEIMEHCHHQMATLEKEMSGFEKELAAIDSAEYMSDIHHMIRTNAVMEMEAFISDTENHPDAEQILLQKHEFIQQQLAVYHAMAARNPQDPEVLPIEVQAMHMQLAMLDQAINKACHFNHEGERVHTRAEAQYTLPNTKKLVKDNGKIYIIDAMADFTQLNEAKREEAHQNFLQQAPQLRAVIPALKHNREEEMQAFAKIRHQCKHKMDHCHKSQELLKVKVDTDLQALAQQIPGFNPVFTPVQKSTTKPTVSLSPAPKPDSAFKQFKKEFNFFRDNNLTKGQVLDRIAQDFPLNLQDQAKNYANKVMADLRPGDVVPAQLRADLDRQFNQQQQQAFSPLKMVPRPTN